MSATQTETRLRADLAEDRLTAWVPDVLGSADLEEAADAGLADPAPAAMVVTVPRPDGRREARHVLSPAVVAALHEACDGLRDAVDGALAPGVCGYRRGADAGQYYADEFLRFQEYTRGETENAGFVVYADVQAFFGGLLLPTLLDRVAAVAGREALRLGPVVDTLLSAGLRTLPAGYADARLLANACLAAVDEDLVVPFARWVDDYRLFVPVGQDPQDAVAGLRAALDRVGLQLNESKTRVLPAAGSAAASRDSLTSVYHPERCNPARDRASLRATFHDAAGDPVTRRRALRFVLRRLGAERDDAAVPFALASLAVMPWEAPRLVSYLSAFADRDDVAARVASATCEAAARDDAWLVARMAPLVARMSCPQDLIVALAGFVSRTDSPAAWGLALRCLGIAGAEGHVNAAIRQRIPDPRAAVAALADLGLPAGRASTLAPSAAAICGHGPAPVPSADSIL